jgi:hypothetical protein
VLGKLDIEAVDFQSHNFDTCIDQRLHQLGASLRRTAAPDVAHQKRRGLWLTVGTPPNRPVTQIPNGNGDPINILLYYVRIDLTNSLGQTLFIAS